MSKIKEGLWEKSTEDLMTDFYDEQMNNMFFKTDPRMEYKHPTTRAMMSEEMDRAISTKPKDAVNPPHYKDIIPGFQYMEMMVYMLKGKDGVESHLFGQIYKYLMRCGSKDEEVQELSKAKWYLDALLKYKQEGKVL
jgi:hypothetical protein